MSGNLESEIAWQASIIPLIDDVSFRKRVLKWNSQVQYASNLIPSEDPAVLSYVRKLFRNLRGRLDSGRGSPSTLRCWGLRRMSRH
jgi:hypothetical protein